VQKWHREQKEEKEKKEKERRHYNHAGIAISWKPKTT